MLLNPILSLLVVVIVKVNRQLSKGASSQESDFANPGTTTIESISNAGHSVIDHNVCARTQHAPKFLCHADSCPPSLPEVKQWYLPMVYFVSSRCTYCGRILSVVVLLENIVQFSLSKSNKNINMLYMHIFVHPDPDWTQTRLAWMMVCLKFLDTKIYDPIC